MRAVMEHCPIRSRWELFPQEKRKKGNSQERDRDSDREIEEYLFGPASGVDGPTRPVAAPQGATQLRSRALKKDKDDKEDGEDELDPRKSVLQ